jgi:hypothetical protein
LEILARTLIGATISAPLSLIAISEVVGINKDIPNPFSSLGVLGIWIALLWAFALAVGVPATLFISNVVFTVWKRAFAIIGLGLLSATVMLLTIGGALAVFGAPAGAITAAACFLTHYDILRQESFEFMGRTYGRKPESKSA